MHFRSSRRIPLLVAGALAVAGCSGDESAGGLSSEDYSVSGALAEIPRSVLDEAEQPMISTGNVSAAATTAGVEPSDDPEQIADWMMPLTAQADSAVFVPYGGGFELNRARVDIEKWADVVGFTIADVEAFVSLDAPPVQLTVAAGEFDDTTLSSDLVEVADGIVSDSELNDLQTDLENVDDFISSLGRPTRLAQRDQLVGMAASTNSVAAWLDSDSETAADDPELAALAEALDARDVYSAVLVSGQQWKLDPAVFLGERGVGEASAAQIMNEYGEVIPQQPFSAVAIGWAVDDADEPTVSIAYHFDSEDAATPASEQLEELYTEGTSMFTAAPISEILTVAQVSVDGQVVVVEATIPESSHVQNPMNMLQQHEIVFAHNGDQTDN